MMYAPQIKSGIFGRVDELPMSRSARLRAKAYMRDGERIAILSCRALAGIHSAAGALARSVKALFARPARH